MDKYGSESQLPGPAAEVAASCGLAPANRMGGGGMSLHVTASRFMAETNLGTQEKLLFFVLSFLF